MLPQGGGHEQTEERDRKSPAGAAAPAGAPSLLSGPLVPLVVIGVLFFFLLILPERKKQKQRQSVLRKLLRI